MLGNCHKTIYALIRPSIKYCWLAYLRLYQPTKFGSTQMFFSHLEFLFKIHTLSSFSTMISLSEIWPVTMWITNRSRSTLFAINTSLANNMHSLPSPLPLPPYPTPPYTHAHTPSSQIYKITNLHVPT